METSSPGDGHDAAQGHTEVVVGLLTDPGMPTQLGATLATDLPEVLANRLAAGSSGGSRRVVSSWSSMTTTRSRCGSLPKSTSTGTWWCCSPIYRA
jgi:hypothetical protein